MLELIKLSFLALALAAQGADGAEPAILEIHIQGIKNYGGEIGAAVFNAKMGYPVHLEHAYEAEWLPLERGKESVIIVFDALPAGDYAVSVLHDENGNRKVDRGGVGFPKEGVGFSNEQKVTLKAPGFAKSKLRLAAGEKKRISITLDYRHRKAPPAAKE